MSALIEFDAVCKYYQMGDTTVKAADHITMKIEKGEFVAIVGQSGSGKSTCMNIIGCLDVPTHGTYRLNGKDVGRMSRNELASVRNEMLGFIFQQYNLLPKLTLLQQKIQTTPCLWQDEDMRCGMEALKSALPKLIQLAEAEQACRQLADEIERTRRRVNALEYVLIPQYQQSARRIAMQLEENDRATNTRLRKVKDLVLSRR